MFSAKHEKSDSTILLLNSLFSCASHLQTLQHSKVLAFLCTGADAFLEVELLGHRLSSPPPFIWTDIEINLDGFHNFLLCSHVICLNYSHLTIGKVSAYFSVVLGYFLEFKERIGIPPDYFFMLFHCLPERPYHLLSVAVEILS